MKKIGYILFLVLLSACTERKEKIIDASDIIPQSKRNYDKVQDEMDTGDSTRGIRALFNGNGIEVDSLIYSDQKQFPDRFGPKGSEKYKISNSEESFEYYNWTFKDSVKTVNAFYNWVDMFEVDQLGDEVNFQREPMCIMVGDTSLIFISGSAISIDTWIDYHKAIGFDEEWHYLVQQKLGSRARWFTFADGEKVRFKSSTL